MGVAHVWEVIFLQVNVLAHLPHLHDVVFSDAGHHPAKRRQRTWRKKRRENLREGHEREAMRRAHAPWVIGVPAEIRDLGRVSAVHKQQLRRPVA